MKAIVYRAPRDFRVESVPDPKLQASTEAVLRVERTAICGSDLHLWHGAPLPVSFVMGHEFMGVVEDVGSDLRRFRRGDRVLASCTLGLPLIEQGRLDPTEIITHRMRLADGIRGYETFDAHAEDVLKVVLQP